MEPKPRRRCLVQLGEHTLAYRETGDPGDRPVVLLHALASDASTWDGLATSLAATGYRVLAPDFRGHGGSSRSEVYTLLGLRDDIVGFVDRLALGPTVLGGHSLGGHIASLVAQSRPDLVSRLVIEDAPPPPRESPTEHSAMSSGRASRLRLGSAVRMLASLSSVRRLVSFDRAMATAVIGQLREADPTWWERLPAIRAPTLLIYGGPNSHVPPDSLAEVARAIPDCRLVTIAAGHRVHSRCPDEFGEAVLSFLASPWNAA